MPPRPTPLVVTCHTRRSRPWSGLRSGAGVRTLAVVASAAALALSVGPAAHARDSDVPVDETYAVPAGGQLTLTGHGFGHGHGMSQYGAQGAALQGLTSAQILAFYYPGLTPGTVTGNVRVLITADTDDDTRVRPAGGLTVRDLGNQSTYVLPRVAGARQWRLKVGGPGRNKTVVQFLTRRWHVQPLGGRRFLTGDGQFTAQSPLTLLTPAGSRVYRGALRAASPVRGSRHRDTVDVLSMDNYVKGVVASEMPASWRPAALQTQAVAARTYATWSRQTQLDRYYQICDTTACQVYGGVSSEDSRTNAAVDATAAQVLTYQGQAAFTQFSASSGGWLSAGSMPYLVAKADPYDDFAANHVHTWTKTVDAGALQRAYPSIGTLQAVRITSRDGNGDWGGRVGTVVLDGTRADKTLTGDQVRSFYGLRSKWFTITPGAAVRTVPTVAPPA